MSSESKSPFRLITDLKEVLLEGADPEVPNQQPRFEAVERVFKAYRTVSSSSIIGTIFDSRNELFDGLSEASLAKAQKVMIEVITGIPGEIAGYDIRPHLIGYLEGRLDEQRSHQIHKVLPPDLQETITP